MSHHLTEEDLILHYYGDDDNRATATRHLESCAACRAALTRLTTWLGAVKTSEPPQPLHGLEERTWRKLHDRIVASRRPRLFAFPVRQWAYAAGIAAALVLAFFAGKYMSRPDPSVFVAQNPPDVVRERILLITVADHLDRTQLMLLELVNADSTEGLEFDRERAANLVADNRMYRQAAARDGDLATAAVLADLERVLMEIENAPDTVGSDELASLRVAIEDKGLLLKVRVVGSQAREKVTRPLRDSLASAI